MPRLPNCLSLLLALAACHHDPPPLTPLSREAIASYLDARLAAATGDWAGTADDLAAAAAAAPGEPMIAVELARAQAKAGRELAARDTILAARAKWPKHPQVWLASADLLARVSPDEAAKAYRRTIDLDPDDERAYIGLARVHPDDAEQTLRELVSHVPSSVDGRYRLALKLETHDTDAAMAQLRLVLERDPDQIDARLDLARALRRRGDLAGAIANTRSAFDRTGQALDVAEELFWLLCEADDEAGAIDLLTLLDDDRSDVEALALVARLDRGLGRLDEARGVAAKIAAQDPDAGAIVLAETDAAAGDLAGAATRALAIADAPDRASGSGSDADSPPRHFAAARRKLAAEAYLAAGDPEHARSALAPARAKLRDDLGLALDDAYALVDLGKLADARALLAAIPPGKHAAERRARAGAAVADRAGDKPDAIARLDRYLAAHADDAVALNLCGYLLADTRTRLADAARYLAKARDLSPGDPAVLDSFGWMQLQFREHARDAVRTLDRASRFAPREPEILLHLATVWAADGAPRTAGRVLDRRPRRSRRRPPCKSGSTSCARACSDRIFSMKWLAAWALAIGACSKAPTEDQCKQLLDHLVDLEFKKAGVQATSDQMKTDIAKQKAAVVDAKCEGVHRDLHDEDVAKARIECAINAADQSIPASPTATRSSSERRENRVRDDLADRRRRRGAVSAEPGRPHEPRSLGVAAEAHPAIRREAALARPLPHDRRGDRHARGEPARRVGIAGS